MQEKKNRRVINSNTELEIMLLNAVIGKKKINIFNVLWIWNVRTKCENVSRGMTDTNKKMMASVSL